MITTLTGLFCTSIALMLYDRHTSRESMVEEHQILLQVIAHRSTAAMAFRDQRGARQNLEALSQQKTIELACLYDVKKNLFLGVPTEADCPKRSPNIRENIQGQYLHILEPIAIEEKQLGGVYAKASLRVLNEKLERLSWFTGMIVLLVALLALIMTSTLQKIISRPILLLSRISHRVSEDNDYSRRANYDSGDELGVLVRSFNSMMSTIEKAQDELKNLAFKDGLTGLPNRRAFMASLEQALLTAQDSGEKMALFLVDLDGFKAVNDQLGHEAGDWVLVVVSERLSKGIRGNDVAARLGGDEFTLLVRDIQSIENVGKMAQKVCDMIDEPIYYKEQLAKVSSSIGISLVPEDGYDAHSLFKLADSAMYDAKKAGKNGYVYGNASIQKCKDQADIPDDLLETLLVNNRLQLWVEPLVQIENKSVVGGEILIYQTLPEGGVTPFQVDIDALPADSPMIEKWQAWFFNALLESLTGVRKNLLEKPMALSFVLPRVLWKTAALMNYLESVDQVCEAESVSVRLTVPGEHFSQLHPIRTRLKEFNHITLAYEVQMAAEFNADQLAEYPVSQIRFLNKFEDARVEDKKVLGETRFYMNTLLVELCQHLNYDSVALNLTRSDQLDRLSHLNCVYGQGKLLANPLVWQKFLEIMRSPTPLSVA